MPKPADPTLSEGDTDSEKWCTHCGHKKSVREFDVDEQRADGRRDVCKKCRADIRQADKEKLQHETIQALEEEGLATLKTLSSGGSFVPHSNELLEAVMRPFGGVSGYAKHLFATYLACDPGSNKRVQIHKMIFELAQQVTTIGQSEQQLEDMDSEDIRLTMMRYLLEYQDKAKLSGNMIPTLEGSIVDASLEIKDLSP